MALTTINSGGVKDDSIVNADIKSDAAIAGTKIAPNFGSQDIVTTGDLTVKEDDYGRIEIIPTAGNGGTAVIKQTTTSPRNGGDLAIQVDSSIQGGNLLFRTGGNNERLRIASDSNITQTIDTDGDGFIITSASNIKAMLTGNTNRSAAGNTIFGISGKWNNTEVGRIAFEAGDDTTNKDDGIINFYTTPSGGSLTSRLKIDSTGQLQATGAADVRLTLGSSGTAGTNDSVHVRADGANLSFMAASGGITKFEQNGTERFRIAADGVSHFAGDVKVLTGDVIMGNGRGINFSADANAGGMTSETLDDYEEGTFTPTLQAYDGSSWGDVSLHANQGTLYGRYTKIGNVVHISIYCYLFHVQDAHDSDGAAFTLPFTVTNASDSFAILSSGHYNCFETTGHTNFLAYANTTRAVTVKESSIYYNTWSGSNNRYLMVSGCYTTAS